MKNIYAIALCLFALNSCKQEQETVYQEQVRIQKAELGSGVVIDTIFLGLRFGMTEQEFEDHCYKLKQQGKIEQEGKMYFYRLAGTLEEYQCFFAPEYFEGKLYKVLVVANPKKSAGLALTKFVEMAIVKYNAEMVINKEMREYSGCKSYNLFKGNLEINIYCNIHGEAIMSYTDKPTAIRIENAKNAQSKKATQDF